MIAKIAVSAANFAIDKPYSYFVPEEMAVSPGMRVTVPFGRGNRPVEGMVLELAEGEGTGLKAVANCLDEEPVLSGTMLHLAAFMRERYFCTFYDAAHAMLPAGLWFQTKQRYALTEDRAWQEKPPRQKNALAVLTLLAELGGQAEESALQDAVPDSGDFQKAIAYLLKKKWITCQTNYRRRTIDKVEKLVTLAVPVEEAMAYASSRPKSAAMQRSVLTLLCGVGAAAEKEICYFTGAKPATVRRLAALGYVTLTEQPVLRCRQIQPAVLDGPLVLSEEQQQVFAGLSQQMAQETPGVALLYGVTGSGKTSVYLKLIHTCLERGGSAMLLVPEIALTPQLLGLVAAHFGERVAVLHSSLPAGERYDQWKRIHDGRAKVVVGTRSAVFAPCQNLRLVILDEEQEHSYKSENTPRYAAKEVAIWRGAKEKALVLLGSATPSVESMYRADSGDYRLYRLFYRYNGKPLPEVEIVDMRQELEAGNDSSISRRLLQGMKETAGAGKQTILFLNRRGNSRALVCVDCRETPECPRCSARLTYHSANGRLMCHYCGFSIPVPKACPKCGGRFKPIGVGTQKAEEELKVLLPGLTVDRMDADTVSAAHTHEQILRHFQQEKVNVLLGTQMVAKGLNLPEVTLVGVLDADLSLYADSFRAAETTFHMLTQVVGRAGRGDTPGKAVIQTLAPEHQVIGLGAKQDYDGFYKLELPLRRLQSLPPFGDLVTVTFSGQEEPNVLQGAEKFRLSLCACLREEAIPDCTVLGPAPCAVPKINYHFRYRLMLRCRLTRPLRGLLAQLLRQFWQDRQTRGVSAFVDVNGYE